MEEEIIRPNCPDCLSDHVAWILWGRPSYDERLKIKIANKEYVLGGCMIPKNAPEWECLDCGKAFGLSPWFLLFQKNIKRRNEPEIAAARTTELNEAVIKASVMCGCFSCETIFPASTVRHWVRDIGNGETATALCPNCTMNTVIGDASGFPITETFLQRIHTLIEKLTADD